MEPKREPVELELVVDGNKISIDFDFVRDILANITAGAVGSLKGVEQDWKELELRIKR